VEKLLNVYIIAMDLIAISISIPQSYVDMKLLGIIISVGLDVTDKQLLHLERDVVKVYNSLKKWAVCVQLIHT
jgi:hypothetical protein